MVHVDMLFSMYVVHVCLNVFDDCFGIDVDPAQRQLLLQNYMFSYIFLIGAS